jgi:hypothetical protein
LEGSATGLLREVKHEPPRQMRSTMPNLEERTAMGCGDGFAPQGLQAVYVATVATFADSSVRIFSVWTCATLAT